MSFDRTAYEGRTYLADTSAWVRAAAPTVEEQWLSALRNRQLTTCPIVRIELLYSAKSGAEYDGIDVALGVLRDIPITRAVTNGALAAYRTLAHHEPRYQRSVTLRDLLIAAAAADAGVGVLHYDRHFDRLAQVLEFESRWIVPAGSL